MKKNIFYLFMLCMMVSIIASCKKDDWDYNADGYTISSQDSDSDDGDVAVISCGEMVV